MCMGGLGIVAVAWSWEFKIELIGLNMVILELKARYYKWIRFVSGALEASFIGLGGRHPHHQL